MHAWSLVTESNRVVLLTRQAHHQICLRGKGLQEELNLPSNGFVSVRLRCNLLRCVFTIIRWSLGESPRTRTGKDRVKACYDTLFHQRPRSGYADLIMDQIVTQHKYRYHSKCVVGGPTRIRTENTCVQGKCVPITTMGPVPAC